MKYFSFVVIMSLVVAGCSRPDLSHTLTLSPAVIHVVGRQDQFPDGHQTAMGFCRGNEIWILGRISPEGKVFVDEKMLGHEILHILFRKYTDLLHFPDDPYPLTLWTH